MKDERKQGREFVYGPCHSKNQPQRGDTKKRNMT